MPDQGQINSVWYRFTPTAGGMAHFDTCTNVLYDGYMASYTGNAVNNLTNIVFNDDGCGGFQTFKKIRDDGFGGGKTPFTDPPPIKKLRDDVPKPPWRDPLPVKKLRDDVSGPRFKKVADDVRVPFPFPRLPGPG